MIPTVVAFARDSFGYYDMLWYVSSTIFPPVPLTPFPLFFVILTVQYELVMRADNLINFIYTLLATSTWLISLYIFMIISGARILNLTLMRLSLVSPVL
jgi:hypothetical protein